jgi:hypothetical protein
VIAILLGFFGYPLWSGAELSIHFVLHSNSHESLTMKALAGFALGFGFGFQEQLWMISAMFVALFH